MLKDIAGIRLRGANFKKESDLLLFYSTKKTILLEEHCFMEETVLVKVLLQRL